MAWPLLGKLVKSGGWRPHTSAFSSPTLLYMLGFLLERDSFIKPLKISVLDQVVFAHVYIFSSYSYNCTLLINSLIVVFCNIILQPVDGPQVSHI